ncbi:unnamed protein product [Citrullus colocynthis]|uniref:Uncharacterized protein n=1 Tax=Citrullus colocynthis TaxID=252529 RepID=A0ABP0YY98_9ROSI
MRNPRFPRVDNLIFHSVGVQFGISQRAVFGLRLVIFKALFYGSAAASMILSTSCLDLKDLISDKNLKKG